MIEFLSHATVLMILLALSAFFSGSESALFSLSQIERRRIAQKHPVISKTVETLLTTPRRTLITILIGNMLVNTMAVVVVTLAAIQTFGERGVSATICVFTVILVIASEITPKVFAVRNNVLFAELTAVILNAFAILLFPIRYIVRRVSDFVLSLLVRDMKGQSDLMSENELKALVKIGEEEGVIRKEEEKMIRRLIDLGKRPVRQIMTPRPDLIAFDIQDGREKLVALIKKSHFTYVPVYDGALDNLLGVIPTHDFMLDAQNRLRELIVTPDFVPETKLIDELLEEFRAKGKGFAVCVDEYGSTAGLVTMEDILEEIFGEFYDEYSKEESAIKRLGHDEFLALGKISLHDVNEALGLSLSSESSETLSGWILEELGRIPKLNESFTYEGTHFQVAEVSKHRIQKVMIRKGQL